MGFCRTRSDMKFASFGGDIWSAVCCEGFGEALFRQGFDEVSSDRRRKMTAPKAHLTSLLVCTTQVSDCKQTTSQQGSTAEPCQSFLNMWTSSSHMLLPPFLRKVQTSEIVPMSFCLTFMSAHRLLLCQRIFLFQFPLSVMLSWRNTD